jgi:hypothetical protein
MRGFNEKLFGDKLVAGQLPTQLGLIGSQEVTDFLLDIYPNAAAAYSLRKLGSAYTGSAIRVRRTNLDEADIGFTSLGDLDISALLAFTGTGALDNGFVTTWYDQSGNLRNAVQATAIKQPQIVSAGSVLTNIGGKPTFRTDGINDNLITASFTAISQPFTTFMVSKWISLTNSFPYLLDYGTDRALGYITGAGNKNEMYYGATLASTISINNTTNLLWYALANGASSQISINNETLQTGNSGTFNASSITIGSRSSNNVNSNSYFSEIIFYSSNQSSNRSGIETNINSYYGIY